MSPHRSTPGETARRLLLVQLREARDGLNRLPIAPGDVLAMPVMVYRNDRAVKTTIHVTVIAWDYDEGRHSISYKEPAVEEGAVVSIVRNLFVDPYVASKWGRIWE